MTTLYKNINKPSASIYEHFEIVAHNEIKFKLVVKFRNGDPCGFNTNCCVYVMTPARTFEAIADNHETGAPYKNIYYTGDTSAMQRTAKSCIDAMKKYIEAVYI